MVGGGSGGHITPLLAVAHELRRQQPEAIIWFALEKHSRFATLPRESKDLDGVFEVRAGKFRRYHGESALRRIFDVPTNLKNLRDLWYTGVGYVQSKRLLRRLRPDVVFIKGSSVGVPIGKACAALDIPYFTHDSDSVASLTNRLIAPGAAVHAVGLPLSFYSRSDDSLRYTGIPLSPEYVPVDSALRKKYRKQLGIPEDALIVTVTGGSLGAVRVNKAVRAVAESLLGSFNELFILHQTGIEEPLYGNLPADLRERVREVKFTDELVAFTGAADLVITRAGATTTAELAAQRKACIFIPNPQLANGHQTKNAEYLARHKAGVVITEAEAADPTKFEQVISELLRSPGERKRLAEGIGKVAKTDAAKELTAIILELAKK